MLNQTIMSILNSISFIDQQMIFLMKPIIENNSCYVIENDFMYPKYEIPKEIKARFDFLNEQKNQILKEYYNEREKILREQNI